MGGDTNNRPFIEFVAQRGSNDYNRMRFNKPLEAGLYVTMRNDAFIRKAHIEGDLLNVRYCAINVVTGQPTFEVRIFASNHKADLVSKNIEFTWASLRFATFINRENLASGDFMHWLNKYPKDFQTLITWLKKKAEVNTESTWNRLENSLRKMKHLSERTTKVLTAGDNAEEDKFIDGILNPSLTTPKAKPIKKPTTVDDYHYFQDEN